MPAMNTLMHILIVTEISIINLSSINFCAQRKLSFWKSLIVLIFSTIVIIGIGFFIISKLPFYGNGNGLFILFGFLYLIPMKYLYKESLSRIFIIICTAWIYTMSVFSLSVLISNQFFSNHFVLAELIFQTIIFIITFTFFFKFINKIYTAIIGGLDSRIERLLRWTVISLFLTILMAHFGFVMGENKFYFHIVTIFMLFITAIVTFILLYNIVNDAQRLNHMQQQIFVDPLTGVPNRACFDGVLDLYTQQGKTFSIYFIDLDNFKKVNDVFGHLQGDIYLMTFAKETRKVANQFCGELYRVGGDEFVIVVIDDTTSLESEIRNVNEKCNAYKCGFYGLSIGKTTFSVNDNLSPSEIFERADKSMYVEKNLKHQSNK